MKTLRNLFIVTLSIFVTQYCQAQSGAMKEPVKFKLKNGMTVIVAENMSTAKVYASFTIEGESIAEGNKPGVQYVLDGMLNEIAAQAKTGISFDEKGGNIAVAATDFDNSLAILSTSIQEPVLNQLSFEKVKTALITSINAKDRYYPETITEQALQAVTLNDVTAFYSKQLTPSRAYLTIAGHLTVDAAKALVKRTFANWGETPLYTSSK